MAEFTAVEKEQIRRWGEGLEGDLFLRYSNTGHAMDESVASFAHQMAELVDHLRPKKDGDATVRLPTLFPGGHIAYQALPVDRELAPFLAVVAAQGNAFKERIAADIRQRLVQLKIPALFKVYITPHCPFCPATVTTLLGLAAHSDYIRVTVIDGELFPEAAQQDRVSAAPTVILDDAFRWTGSVKPDELVSLMLDRDPANLGAEALRGMIEEGDAEGVATMMMARGQLFPAFIELLTHPRWSVRLGAMVTFETLAEENADLAGQVVGPVQAEFGDADDMVKGDLLHVLGESGNKTVLPFLEGVCNGAYDEEVRSAAQEAIEKLR